MSIEFLQSLKAIGLNLFLNYFLHSHILATAGKFFFPIIHSCIFTFLCALFFLLM